MDSSLEHAGMTKFEMANLKSGSFLSLVSEYPPALWEDICIIKGL